MRDPARSWPADHAWAGRLRHGLYLSLTLSSRQPLRTWMRIVRAAEMGQCRCIMDAMERFQAGAPHGMGSHRLLETATWGGCAVVAAPSCNAGLTHMAQGQSCLLPLPLKERQPMRSASAGLSSRRRVPTRVGQDRRRGMSMPWADHERQCAAQRGAVAGAGGPVEAVAARRQLSDEAVQHARLRAQADRHRAPRAAGIRQHEA